MVEKLHKEKEVNYNQIQDIKVGCYKDGIGHYGSQLS